jgi:hypothetical protein
MYGDQSSQKANATFCAWLISRCLDLNTEECSAAGAGQIDVDVAGGLAHVGGEGRERMQAEDGAQGGCD